jgi:putative hemolysin
MRRPVVRLVLALLLTGCQPFSAGISGPPKDVTIGELTGQVQAGDRVMFVGTVSQLGELFCSCFVVSEGGASAVVWSDVPGETTANVTGIGNGDEVRVEGDLQADPDPGSGFPVVWATSIEPISAELANPASVYCEEQGGVVDLREGEGGTAGHCVFADGTECEEWAYFRGECSPGSG